MAVNGSGVRDTARVLKISTNTVLKELKKEKPNTANKLTVIKTAKTRASYS